MPLHTGKITAISGSVVLVKFQNNPPAIFNALRVNDLILEVQSYADENTVRALAMGSTQGLARGMNVEDLGHPIEVPVGQKVLGRMFNVLGQPLDDKAPLTGVPTRSIHAQSQPIHKLNVSNKIFVKIGASFPRGILCERIALHNTELVVITGAPLEIIHKTPKIIAANIHSFVDGFFDPLEKPLDVSNAIGVFHDAVGADRLVAFEKRSVFGNVDRDFQIIEIVEQMDGIVHGLGVVLGAVVEEVTALGEIHLSLPVHGNGHAIVNVEAK